MAAKQLVQLELAAQIEAGGRPVFPCRAGLVDAVILEDDQGQQLYP